MSRVLNVHTVRWYVLFFCRPSQSVNKFVKTPSFPPEPALDLIGGGNDFGNLQSECGPLHVVCNLERILLDCGM